MEINVGITGAAALQRELDKLGPELAGKVIRSAALSALVPVQKAMIEMAPLREEEGIIGGTLKSSIIRTVKYYKAAGVVMSFVGVAKTGFKKAVGLRGRTVIYANPTNYAHLLEFGHRIAVGGSLERKGHPKSGGGQVAGTVAPRPFIAKALEQNAPAVMSRFEKQVAKGLLKMAAKIDAKTRAAGSAAKD